MNYLVRIKLSSCSELNVTNQLKLIFNLAFLFSFQSSIFFLQCPPVLPASFQMFPVQVPKFPGTFPSVPGAGSRAFPKTFPTFPSSQNVPKRSRVIFCLLPPILSGESSFFCLLSSFFSLLSS